VVQKSVSQKAEEKLKPDVFGSLGSEDADDGLLACDHL
jgi:hypothetical protein